MAENTAPTGSGPAQGRQPAPELYWRCRSCRLVATYSSSDWVIDKDRQDGIDWTCAVEVSCMICYTKQELTHDQVLALDSTSECSRCHANVPCPA